MYCCFVVGYPKSCTTMPFRFCCLLSALALILSRRIRPHLRCQTHVFHHLTISSSRFIQRRDWLGHGTGMLFFLPTKNNGINDQGRSTTDEEGGWCTARHLATHPTVCGLAAVVLGLLELLHRRVARVHVSRSVDAQVAELEALQNAKLDLAEERGAR